MVTRLMLIFLCLGVLSTVTGCYVEPTSYGTSSYGRRTDYETPQYPWECHKQRVRQDGPYRPWKCHSDYGND